eukprot:UN31896
MFLQLDKFAEDFNKSYVLPGKDYLKFAGEGVLEKLNSVISSIEIGENERDEVFIGLEVYVVSKIHNKISKSFKNSMPIKIKYFMKPAKN